MKKYYSNKSITFNFESAKILKNPEKYAINLLWLNKAFDYNQKFIHPSKTEKGLIEELLTPAIRWAQKNKEAKVYIWYDGSLSSDEAIDNTKKILLRETKNIDCANIELKDLRNIDVIKNNPDVFLAGMPLYFRIDLLKLILCLHSVKDLPNQYAVYSDLTVGDYKQDRKVMNKEQLFKDEIIEKLNNSGLIINGIENQFLQVINQPEIIQALTYIINVNLLRAINALNNNYEKIIPSKQRYMSKLYNAVFFDTINNIHRYHSAIKYGTIKIQGDIFGISDSKELIEYDPECHGYEPFGLFYNHNTETYLYINPSLKPFPVSKYVKLYGKDQKAIDLSLDGDFSRHDVDVRSGSSHTDEFDSNMLPADGSNKFKCWLLPVKGIKHKITLNI